MKNELGGKIMTSYLVSYLIDDVSEDKKSKRHKKVCRKKKLKKFENYQNCLEAIQLDNKIKYLEKMKLI